MITRDDLYGDAHYTGLNVDQIKVADAMTDLEFDAWARRGAPLAHLNALIEQQRVRTHKGQRDPGQQVTKTKGYDPILAREKELGRFLTEDESNEIGQTGEHGLQLRPSRVATSYDIEAADESLRRFLNRFQQVVPSEENLKTLANFLHSRGALCNERNLKIAFENLWGKLSLRTIVKEIEEATTKLNKRGQRVAADPYFFPKPVKAELVEVVLSPADVRNLSSVQMDQFMKPMSFPGLTDSADAYARSEEFLADTPPREPRRQTQQTQAQIGFEVKAFVRAHPEYEKYIGDESFAGLYKVILGKIDDANLLITDSSLLDGFRWAEQEGILPTENTVQSGQVVKMKVTPDGRPGYWTKESVRKAVSKMTAAELQEALNSDREFRDLLDAS